MAVNVTLQVIIKGEYVLPVGGGLAVVVVPLVVVWTVGTGANGFGMFLGGVQTESK